jgi:hypothetical protein
VRDCLPTAPGRDGMPHPCTKGVALGTWLARVGLARSVGGLRGPNRNREPVGLKRPQDNKETVSEPSRASALPH